MNINLNSIGSQNPKRSKFDVGTLIFLLIFGAIFTGVGYAAINKQKVSSDWQHTSGKVVDVSSRISDGSTTYTPVVEYSVDGQQYRITGAIGTSFMPIIGESKEVAYNPNQPYEAKTVESSGVALFVWIFPSIGIIILIIAPISFIMSLRRSKNISELIRTGQKLQGVLTEIRTINRDNNTYKIVVTAVNNSGNTQNYVSDSVSNIGALLTIDFRTNPVPIDVYIDPSNPQKYYVNISSIPNLTSQKITEIIS